MSSIYGKIGESKPDYLLSDPKDGDKIAVPMYPGNGVVKRGRLLFRESNGMYSPAAAADAVDNNSLVVLDETVDTDVSETIAENAAGYCDGHWFVPIGERVAKKWAEENLDGDKYVEIFGEVEE